MVILFLGISGSGKDTQANLIKQKYGFEVVSTGSLIREEIESGSELGNKIDDIVNDGEWVEDEIVYDLLAKRLDSVDTDDFILTGAVRDIHQVEMLDQALAKIGYVLDKVVLFKLDKATAVERISGRRYDADGNTYHIKYNPAPAGVELETREDDHPEAIENRFDEYEETIAPILKVYRDRGILIELDARPGIEEVEVDVHQHLGLFM